MERYQRAPISHKNLLLHRLFLEGLAWYYWLHSQPRCRVALEASEWVDFVHVALAQADVSVVQSTWGPSVG